MWAAKTDKEVETAVKQWSKEQNTDFHGQAMKM
jgi:hypothetical protein